MFNSLTQPQVPISEKGQGHKDSLEVLLYTHIGVSISKIIIMGFAFGFGDLFQCLILWCALS